MNEIDKLAWVCIKNKCLLLARSKNKDTYYLPGGKREHGESDEAALIREIREELTVELIPASIRYIGAFNAHAHEKPQGIQVKMTCYLAEFKGEISASAEIEEVIWLNTQNKVKCSPVTKIIMDWLKSKEMID